MFDKDVGVNWHLRFRLKIEELEKDKNQTGNLIKQLDVFVDEERIRIKKQQPRLIKIKTMKQVEASVTQEPYQEEHF